MDIGGYLRSTAIGAILYVVNDMYRCSMQITNNSRSCVTIVEKVPIKASN